MCSTSRPGSTRCGPPTGGHGCSARPVIARERASGAASEQPPVVGRIGDRRCSTSPPRPACHQPRHRSRCAARAGVAASTRERIVGISAQLGYRTRSSSSSVALLTIGLLVKAKPRELDVANAFYGPLMAGITAQAPADGIDLRLDSMLVDEHFEPIGVPRLVRSLDVDGLLVLGAYLSDGSATMLGERPLVLVDGYSETADRFATVVTDNVDGALRATRHLIELGHRHIALAGTTPRCVPLDSNGATAIWPRSGVRRDATGPAGAARERRRAADRGDARHDDAGSLHHRAMLPW